MSNKEKKAVSICHHLNALVMGLIALYLLIFPGVSVLRDLSDPNIRSGGIPRSAWALHRGLSLRSERWANERLNSTRASELSTANISGTEWPLFGSVFYLWATEALQDDWERAHHSSAVAPVVYAKDAIQAAMRLVIDPQQANWVKIHWGTNYLKTENVFYRMLVISALTSHTRLTGDKQHLPLLKDQVESLAVELDASRHGLLNDYPGECYPGDVLTAIAMIQRADRVLGTDHSGFIKRAIRGFQGPASDPRGLVPYSASALSGKPTSPTRGCGNSYVSLFSPEIWPEQARAWYELYSQYFWQETWTGAGFREFPKDVPSYDWYLDVDAGPVVKGFGFAACAFGVGAARVNGRMDHAYPLTAEMLAASWPLPNGTLLLPRLLSDATDAPYLGESAILFNLTRLPLAGLPITKGDSIPGFVAVVIALQLGVGLCLLAVAIRSLLRWRKRSNSLVFAMPRIQLGIWICLLLAASIFLIYGKLLISLLLLFIAQFFPKCRKVKT